MSTGEVKLTWKKVDDCWRDDRRFWCAYCGLPMRRRGIGETSATKDHIVPKAHGGRFVKLPACRKCNQAKADMSLDAFLGTEYFVGVRKHRHPYQWPIHELWYALAREATLQAWMHKPKDKQSRPSGVPRPTSIPPAGFGKLL